MTEDLKQYILNWKSIDGINPKNEPIFIDLFDAFMDSLMDSSDIEFDGDGSYFGKQVTIQEDRNYTITYGYGFEICYSAEKISVYRDDHNGFWTPEYISLSSEDAQFNKVKEVVHRTLLRLFGLNVL